MEVTAIILTLLASALCVLAACLLVLTPKQFSDETRVSRLKRSLGHKPANVANPYAPRNIEQPPRPWRGREGEG